MEEWACVHSVRAYSQSAVMTEVQRCARWSVMIRARASGVRWPVWILIDSVPELELLEISDFKERERENVF